MRSVSVGMKNAVGASVAPRLSIGARTCTGAPTPSERGIMSDPNQGQDPDWYSDGQYQGTYGNGNPQAGYPRSGSMPTMDPFRLIVEDMAGGTMKAIRIVLGAMGALGVVLGLALLLWPDKTLIALTVILGIYFIISGVVRLATSIVAQGLPGGWRILGILFGALIAIGGIVIIKNTALSASALTILVTMIVGIGWIMEGVMSLAASWGTPHSGWAIFSGVVSILAGICVMIYPLGSVMFLVIFSGCALLVLGIVSIIRAFSFGRR